MIDSSLFPECNTANEDFIRRTLFLLQFYQSLYTVYMQHPVFPVYLYVALQFLFGQSRQFYDLLRARVVRKVQFVFLLHLPRNESTPKKVSSCE